MKNNQKNEQKDVAIRVSIVSIIVNIALSGFKLLAGILANSQALISDAVHSASDVLSTFVVMAGVNMSGKGADKDHPYGHERIECVAAIILSVMLLATGLGIGYDGVLKISKGLSGELAVPGVLAIVAAGVSIAVKEWMYWYTVLAAKRINSGALKADAWHHRSDAMSSVGSFVGVLGARMGFPVLDPVACIVICLFIMKAAYDIFMDAIGKMTDRACDDETVEAMRKLVLSQKGVKTLDLIKTRLFGSKIYVDIELGVPGDMSLNDAHDIAIVVHDAIEGEFENVKHCMVHVNPSA